LHGILVSISGATTTQGVPITVNAQFRDKPPTGTPDHGLNGPTFFDVKVTGISGGSVTVSITHDNVVRGTKVKYLDKDTGKWEWMKTPVLSGGTISGSVDVGKLRWTPIVIGT